MAFASLSLAMLSPHVRIALFFGSSVGLGLFAAVLTHRYLHRQKTQLFERNPYKRPPRPKN